MSRNLLFVLLHLHTKKKVFGEESVLLRTLMDSVQNEMTAD